jgi:hypothetical protein
LFDTLIGGFDDLEDGCVESVANDEFGGHYSLLWDEKEADRNVHPPRKIPACIIATAGFTGMRL